MARRGLWVAVCGAAAIGCSDKPRPIQEAKPVTAADADATIELPKDAAPAKSDPAAAKVVADAVAAHTDGHPELLEKLKTFRLTRTGTLVSSGSLLNWQFRASWPDKFRLDDTDAKTVISRVGSTAWMYGPTPQGQQKVALQSPQSQGPIADGTYEWLGVLVPLADPQLVAAPYPERVIGGKPAVGVRLSSPNLPNAVAHFDAETKQLVQFSYEGFEAGGPVLKEVRVSDPRPVEGIRIPHKLAIKWAGRPAVEWTVSKIEFPVDLPAKLFEDPAEK